MSHALLLIANIYKYFGRGNGKQTSFAQSLRNLSLLCITCFLFYHTIYETFFQSIQTATEYFIGPFLYTGLTHIISLSTIAQYYIGRSELFALFSRHDHQSPKATSLVYSLVITALSALFTICMPWSSITSMIGTYLFVETNLKLSYQTLKENLFDKTGSRHPLYFLISISLLYALVPAYRLLQISPLLSKLFNYKNTPSIMHQYCPAISDNIFPLAINNMFRANMLGCLSSCISDQAGQLEKKALRTNNS